MPFCFLPGYKYQKINNFYQSIHALVHYTHYRRATPLVVPNHIAVLVYQDIFARL